MPVLITGATGMIGRALAERLVHEGAQVRAFVRRDDAELRRIGVHVAIGAIDNVERLEAALTRVHTVVHLVGGIWPARDESYHFLNWDTTESAVIAARAADVRRFVYLSFPGADPASSNEFLAAKGKAEEEVRDSGLEHVIFRCAPVLEGLRRTFERLRRGRMLALPGDGAQRMNPITLSEVVDALVAADSREEELRGTWDLGGGEQASLDELARRTLGEVRISHATRLSPAPRALAQLYARDILVDPMPAARRFGLRTASSSPPPAEHA